MRLTFHGLGLKEIVSHCSDSLINLGVGNDFGQVLQNQHPSRQVWTRIEHVGDVNTSVSTDVNDKWRAALQLDTS